MSNQVSSAVRERRARELAACVVDPELPMLTLAELGVLREVRVSGDRVEITLAPTYSGCPAITEMRADLVRILEAEGFWAEVGISLSPPWTTDDITDTGRAKLAAAGIAPPGSAPRTPVLVQLGRAPDPVACPRCDSTLTEQVSRFGPTVCLALWRCRTCAEPFEHLKAI